MEGALLELNRAVGRLSQHDLTAIPDERLEEQFSGLQTAAQRLEAERLRRLAEINRRQSHRRAGYLSTASWLVDRHRFGWTAAAKDIRTARSLQRMPRTRHALATGELTGSALQMLVAARHAHPAHFHRAEDVLVEAARRLPAPQLHHTVAHWRQQLDWSQGLRDVERVRGQRRLSVSVTMLGTVRLDGELDPETGEVVLTALRDCQAYDRPNRHAGDRRTPPQRRVDALGEICRRWLDTSTRTLATGERPHVSVIVDIRSLEGRSGHRAELEHIGPVHPEATRRLSCDSTVSRVVMRGGSEPLDVGRRTPVVPGPIRRALTVRDRHCRFPGCDRPPPWCEAHHVRHWAAGGVTALSNLVLLCRPHHRMVHEGGYGIVIDGGAVRIEPPTEMTAGAGPPLRAGASRSPLPSAARPDGSTPPRTPSAARG